jgi:hypothetical protein
MPKANAVRSASKWATLKLLFFLDTALLLTTIAFVLLNTFYAQGFLLHSLHFVLVIALFITSFIAVGQLFTLQLAAIVGLATAVLDCILATTAVTTLASCLNADLVCSNNVPALPYVLYTLASVIWAVISLTATALFVSLDNDLKREARVVGF